jgi:hypothetical protein
MNNKPAKLVLSQETLRRLTTGPVRRALSETMELNCTDACSDGNPCSRNSCLYPCIVAAVEAQRREL